MHHAGEQPAKEAGELEPAELHHCGVAADGGEIAHVVTQRNAAIINHGTIEPFSEPRRPTLVREGERTMNERTAATGITGQALAPLGRVIARVTVPAYALLATFLVLKNLFDERAIAASSKLTSASNDRPVVNHIH